MDPTNSNLPSVTIDVGEKSRKVISRKPSVKSYATRVFQESTVGIVSSIFTTHSKNRRCFKVFLSSLCIAGFIYSCVAFLNHVFKYPEVVDIYLDRSKTYNWPAYTYCNNNPINRRLFCSFKPQHCVDPSAEFCKEYSSYCGANATLVPHDEYYYELPNDFPYKWILQFGSIPNILNINDSVRNDEPYEDADEITGPYLRADGLFIFRPCYTLHSRAESNLQPLLKTRNVFPKVEDELLRFYVDESVMMNPRSEPGVYFSVHSPFETVNPLLTGKFMKSGRTYRLNVKIQKETLLKAPFESNCKDYDVLWETNNRSGARSKQMCQGKCHFDYDIFRYNCTSLHNQHPDHERMCKNLWEPRVERNGSFNIHKCRKNCRDECRSLKYTTEISEQDLVQELVTLEKPKRHINVKIFLSNDEVQVLRHSPKYETVDVISSIGGFMGCWLGIALLDILDVFGSIINIFRYTFRKRFPKKIKRRQST